MENSSRGFLVYLGLSLSALLYVPYSYYHSRSDHLDREIQTIDGVVTKEGGTVHNILLGNDAYSGLGGRYLNYILNVETDNGEYILDVIQAREYPYRSLFVIAENINVGTRIRFKDGTSECFPVGNRAYFSHERIGSVPSDEIELLEKNR